MTEGLSFLGLVPLQGCLTPVFSRRLAAVGETGVDVRGAQRLDHPP